MLGARVQLLGVDDVSRGRRPVPQAGGWLFQRAHASAATTITLHLPLSQCTVLDDEVLYALTVQQWREWLPAFEAAHADYPAVETFEVRGEG